MVELIVGNKGKGKTKQLLDKVNAAVASATGNIVYLDKSSKHMYELNNKIRLIDVSSYQLKNREEFAGFICGIISQDHDLEQMYLDSFLDLSHLEGDMEGVAACIKRLQDIGVAFNVNFVISASVEKEDLPADLQGLVTVAL